MAVMRRVISLCNVGVELAAMLWHYVDVAWITLFALLIL